MNKNVAFIICSLNGLKSSHDWKTASCLMPIKDNRTLLWNAAVSTSAVFMQGIDQSNQKMRAGMSSNIQGNFAQNYFVPAG